MPFFPISYRPTPVVPFRPPISLRQSTTHFPFRQRPFLTPSVLPILQPPKFVRQSDFIYENDEQKQQRQQDDLYNYLTYMQNDHSRKTTQQLTVRVPQFIPQQNYPRQPLSYFFTRRIRRAEPKYSKCFFPNQ